ncbi:putative riboflavin kinase [Dioszegia hungarica]|uniref:Riboflavin kinase n=1 Tax=Dioszegia hungarica TaxID=4972 RepID=A0AA38H5N4_9TREE|nr:putative riboflavin kinase [Dioszegia hungarica]KAI9634458.1 putative riboflavin kinase [Dioszegia hungarica]
MASSTSPPPRPQAEMAPAFREHRPMIVGGDQPEEPFPMLLEGVVTRGFGRGARFLGIPTANLPDSSLAPLNDLQMTGIYYGFARVLPSTSTPHATAPSTPSLSDTHHSSPLSASTIQSMPAATAPYPPDSVEGDITSPKRLDKEDGRVWPMVMSVGWNPYFKNEKITAEVHIIHPFSHDFYGHDMSVLVLGYIRPELDYTSKDALVQDIQTDVKVALNSLARPSYAKLALDPRLTGGPAHRWDLS